MSEVDASVLDRMFRVLADSRRRVVLAHLLDTEDGAATFDELVEAVVRAETQSSALDRVSVAISLDHKHLALMAEKDLIEYDRKRGWVRTTVSASQFEPIFELFSDLDPLPAKE